MTRAIGLFFDAVGIAIIVGLFMAYWIAFA